MIRATLILVALAGPAHAFDWKCWAKPHSDGCRLAPPPTAPAAPVQAPPPLAIPAQPVTPQTAPAPAVSPPVAAPVVVPPPTLGPWHYPLKRVKTKAVKVKPKPAPVKVKARPKSKPRLQALARQARRKDNSGPDLPWPCWQVRLGVAGKTTAQLRAEGREKGIRLSGKQIRQAKACLASKG